MSDKWMSADAFTDRVEEVHNKLSERWENVHPWDVEHGLFYCCDHGERHVRIRVCDGWGGDLYAMGCTPKGSNCYECKFKYKRKGAWKKEGNKDEM